MSKGSTRLPLLSKSFYVDEVDLAKPLQKKLERCLLVLGATIEKFFTKDITYLITDHAQPSDYKKRSSASATSADDLVSTPSPFAFTPNPGQTTPPDLSSLKTSRGSAILAKCKGNNLTGASSVSPSEQLVRNARQWNIQILRPSDAVHWMDKKISTLKLSSHKVKKNRTPDKTRRKSSSKSRGEKILKAPYLKIEDITGFYRPIFRQFAHVDLPVLNLQTLACPFETRGTTNLMDRKVTAAHAMPSLNSHHQTEVGATCNIQSKLAKKSGFVKKELTYCMICKVRFDNQVQHLRSDQHKKFAMDDENYTAVDKLINSSASMQRFLDDIMKFHPQHKQEGLDEYTELKLFDREVISGAAAENLEIRHRSVSETSASAAGSPISKPQLEEDLPVVCGAAVKQTDEYEAKVSMPLYTAEVIAAVECTTAISRKAQNPSYQIALYGEKAEVLQTLPQVEYYKTSRMDIQSRLDSLSHYTEYEGERKAENGIATDSDSHSVKSVGSVFRPWEDGQSFDDPITVKGKKGLQTENIDKPFLSTAEIVKTRKRTCTKPRMSPTKAKALKKPTLNRTSSRKSKAVDSLAVDKNNSTADSLLLSAVDCVTNQKPNTETSPQRGRLSGYEDPLVTISNGYLQNYNFSRNESEEDLALMSCDTYITNMIKASTYVNKPNTMLQPASPKRSPRHSLCGKETTEEQFSLQKQKFSSRVEKTTPNKRRLDLSKSLSCKSSSDDIMSPEDKENTTREQAATSMLLQDNKAETSFESVFEKSTDPYNIEEFSSPGREQFSGIKLLHNESRPLFESTPAPVGYVKLGASSITNTSPTSGNIRKALFDGILDNINSPAVDEKLHDSSNSSVTVKHAGVQKRGRPKKITKKTEFQSPKTKSKKNTGYLSQAEYDRQVSILSYGSLNNSLELEDVFSAPPTIISLDQESSIRRSLHENNSTAADSQLQTSQSSTGNYDSLHQPKHYKCRPTTELSVVIKRAELFSSSGAKYSSFSEHELSAPGFKCSSKIKKAARNYKKAASTSSHTPYERTRQSPRIQANSKRALKSPDYNETPCKKMRKMEPNVQIVNSKSPRRNIMNLHKNGSLMQTDVDTSLNQSHLSYKTSSADTSPRRPVSTSPAKYRRTTLSVEVKERLLERKYGQRTWSRARSPRKVSQQQTCRIAT